MKLYFYPKYDCILSSLGESVKMFAGQQKIIETNLPANFSVFPIRQTSTILPTFFELELDKNQIVCLNPQIKIFNIFKQTAIVNIEPNYVCFCRSLANLSTKNQDYEIFQNEQVQIKCANRVIYSKNLSCIDAQLYEHENLVFCLLCSLTTNFLVVLDGQNNILVDEEISQVETLEGKFKTLLKYCDMQKQGFVKTYKIENDQLINESEYPVYINQTPKTIYTNKLNSQAFFEAVRAKNLNLAKTFLSQELNSKISLPHLSEYFGNFDTIYNLSLDYANDCFALADTCNNTCSVFQVYKKNNVIENIEKITQN